MHRRTAQRIFLSACAALCAIAFAPAEGAEAATLRNGSATIEESLLAVRYRAFRTTRRSELYLGVPDLRDAGRRREGDAVWAEGANYLTLTFDPASDRLTTTVANAAGEFSLELPDVASTVAALGSGRFDLTDANVLHVTLVDRDPRASVALTGVAIDGEPLGDAPATGTATDVFSVTGHDFAAGFTLTAVLELSGRFVSRPDRSRVEIAIGVADDPYCIVDDAVRDVGAVLDGESPFRLAKADGTPIDPRQLRIGWSFLSDGALYLDGRRDRAYGLCKTDAGVVMALPFRRWGVMRTAHFVVDMVEGGFDLHGVEQTTGEDGEPVFLPVDLTYSFRSGWF